MTEDEMFRWHHRLSGHEFEQALKMVKDREAWMLRSWGHKESDMTEQMSNKNLSRNWF